MIIKTLGFEVPLALCIFNSSYLLMFGIEMVLKCPTKGFTVDLLLSLIRRIAPDVIPYTFQFSYAWLIFSGVQVECGRERS